MKPTPKLRGKDATLDVVDVAERLFDQIGFQKTTVADIARELHMSPANVYRFYSAKSEINEAVGRKLLAEIEAALDEIVRQPGLAKEKLRASIQTIQKFHTQRFAENQKLRELLRTAFDENWSIVSIHQGAVESRLSAIIAQGARDGEFHVDDANLAAVLVRNACISFCNPLLMREAQDGAPGVDEMVDFCIAALG